MGSNGRIRKKSPTQQIQANQWLSVGLGPGGLDSDWILKNERNRYSGVPRF